MFASFGKSFAGTISLVIWVKFSGGKFDPNVSSCCNNKFRSVRRTVTSDVFRIAASNVTFFWMFANVMVPRTRTFNEWEEAEEGAEGDESDEDVDGLADAAMLVRMLWSTVSMLA